MRRLALVAVLMVLVGAATVSAAEPLEKWVWGDCNFLVDADVDVFIAMMVDAKAAGVGTIVVKDPQFAFLNMLPASYHANLSRAIKKAAELEIALVPVIFPFGYGGGYIVQDMNLAAGIPVRNAPFVVSDGKATPDMTAAPKVANASFDEAEGVAGWTPKDSAAGHVFFDADVKHSGAGALRMSGLDSITPPPAEEGRRWRRRASCWATQKVPCEPFQYYRLTVWVKTEELSPPGAHWLSSAEVLITSSDGKRRNAYTNMDIASQQEWTQHELLFNTLEATSIDITIGVETATQGQLWFDDLSIEPAGLANVLRGATKPLKITNADGSVVYEEGKDFEKVVDPELGKDALETVYYVPFPSFRWHEGPAVKVPAGSRIKEGERILVSFYHPLRIYADQIIVSMEDPMVFALMAAQAKSVVEAFKAPGYFMNYDEIRIVGWEEQAGGTHHTPGQILAQHVQIGYDIVKKYAPDAAVYTWSDMLTPTHNARKVDGPGYYLCNGDFYESWTGLKEDIIIANWTANPEGLKFFAERGHKQVMCGYYDGPVQRNIDSWMSASEGAPGIMAMMYTTWSRNYTDLAEFFRVMDEVGSDKSEGVGEARGGETPRLQE